MANLFTIERIFDRDAILTYFAYFLSCSLSFSTHIRGVKHANIGNPWLGSTYAGVSCIKGSDTKDADIENVYTINTYFGGICIRDVFIKDACNMSNDIKGANIDSICGSAYKPSKSSI